jgi:hypothetical protein
MLEDGRAAVLSVTLDALFGDKLADAKLFRLPLGSGRGVRDLAALDDGFLILAGPSADEDGSFAVYWWDGQSESVRLLTDLARLVGKKGKRKAEALLPLDNEPSGLRVLIMFDGEKEGAPTPVVIPRP